MTEPNEPEVKTVSKSERGHAKNLENIKKRLAFATSWGAKYQPTNPILALAFMTQRIGDAETVNDELRAVRAPYAVAVSVAEDAFAPLSKLMTRVERSFKSSGVADSAVEDLKTNTRKVKGRSKKNTGGAGGEVAEKGHSTSQMSRVNRIEYLDSSIEILVEYQFKPNETDLKTTALDAYSTDLKTKTEAVNTAFIPVSNKLDERDEIYYLAPDSLFEISDAFEDYVMSFGTDSNEYNQIRDLDMMKIPRRKNR